MRRARGRPRQGRRRLRRQAADDGADDAFGTLVCNRGQRDELRRKGAGYLDMFRGLGPHIAAQLEGVEFVDPRAGDVPADEAAAALEKDVRARWATWENPEWISFAVRAFYQEGHQAGRQP
ncbi:hypothetical protein [Streptomyces spirodelae]|uniref:TfoX C-terminal domain-containing protein n=1 Tax=Streptomyces spirodelae TaxID=2812904 RepID=A0ABS3X335_9ACTN|nr:hypothetical protein [Streptomyces spirodelae]MBO8189779.1 hypothetical protein [Streptomyces spirodelae]